MLGSYFSHQIIKKSIIIFGALFNNIEIEKSDGDTTKRIKVPLSYSPSKKFIKRLQEDKELSRSISQSLPKMVFEVQSPIYDESRKRNTLNTHQVRNPDGSLKMMYEGVPYNLAFSLNILSNTLEDGTQIIEQILPYFTPEFTVTANLIPEMNITTDIPLILESVSSEDNYEGDIDERREIIWRLEFLMKTTFYGDIKDNQKVINKVMMNFHVMDGDVSSQVSFTPDDTTDVNSTITRNLDFFDYPLVFDPATGTLT